MCHGERTAVTDRVSHEIDESHPLSPKARRVRRCWLAYAYVMGSFAGRFCAACGIRRYRFEPLGTPCGSVQGPVMLAAL
jgi:hypothetical protein